MLGGGEGDYAGGKRKGRRRCRLFQLGRVTPDRLSIDCYVDIFMDFKNLIRIVVKKRRIDISCKHHNA
jgi:hypothetical protein